MRYAYQAYTYPQYIEFAGFCRPDKAFTPHPDDKAHIDICLSPALRGFFRQSKVMQMRNL